MANKDEQILKLENIDSIIVRLNAMPERERPKNYYG